MKKSFTFTHHLRYGAFPAQELRELGAEVVIELSDRITEEKVTISFPCEEGEDPLAIAYSIGTLVGMNKF
jgi:hypothetical protein